MYELEFDYASLIALVVSALFTAYYALTKNYIAANIFALAFSTSAVSLLSLGTFKNGMILLSGLFFYDIFWVFRTDVMVTVAKSFDAPIKVVFPKDIFAETFQFTMLGLGDIVIPGPSLSLAPLSIPPFPSSSTARTRRSALTLRRHLRRAVPSLRPAPLVEPSVLLQALFHRLYDRLRGRSRHHRHRDAQLQGRPGTFSFSISLSPLDVFAQCRDTDSDSPPFCTSPPRASSLF